MGSETEYARKLEWQMIGFGSSWLAGWEAVVRQSQQRGIWFTRQARMQYFETIERYSQSGAGRREGYAK